MRQDKLIAKLIDLEERANAHAAEYQRLQQIPKSKTIASKHYRKALSLQSRIQSIIREIALCEDSPVPVPGVFAKQIHPDQPGLP
jgi:hypothetical protein